MRNVQLIFILLAMLLLAKFAPAQIAVVVNKNNPVNNLSLKELQQIYLGEKSLFTGNLVISLGADANNNQKFVKKLFNWSEVNYKKHWMNLIFSGGNYIAPKEFKRLDQIEKFVLYNEGSIAFVDFSMVNENMKVISINGKFPDDEKYTLK